MPRYSYLGSFILIFLSGCYFSDWKKWGFGIRQLIICLLFPVSQILIERLRPALYQNFFLFNIAFLVIVPCILYEIDRSYRINVKKNFMMGLLACMLIGCVKSFV